MCYLTYYAVTPPRYLASSGRGMLLSENCHLGTFSGLNGSAFQNRNGEFEPLRMDLMRERESVGLEHCHHIINYVHKSAF